VPIVQAVAKIRKASSVVSTKCLFLDRFGPLLQLSINSINLEIYMWIWYGLYLHSMDMDPK